MSEFKKVLGLVEAILTFVEGGSKKKVGRGRKKVARKGKVAKVASAKRKGPSAAEMKKRWRTRRRNARLAAAAKKKGKE